jgi:hypothetical protein
LTLDDVPPWPATDKVADRQLKVALNYLRSMAMNASRKSPQTITDRRN